MLMHQDLALPIGADGLGKFSNLCHGQNMILYAGYGHPTIIEGSLEVKLPTIWTDEQQRWEEPERREE